MRLSNSSLEVDELQQVIKDMVAIMMKFNQGKKMEKLSESVRSYLQLQIVVVWIMKRKKKDAKGRRRKDDWYKAWPRGKKKRKRTPNYPMVVVLSMTL
jgi:hypothetical protein